jgi:hypothetical protein
MTRRDLTSETAEDKFDVEAEARRRGIQPFQVRAANAVNDRLMADIVADARRGISESASMIPPSREPVKPKGTGWVDAAPLKAPDTRWVDAQIDAQDQRDQAAAIKQRIENEWIEHLMSNETSRVASEFNPFDRQNMNK